MNTKHTVRKCAVDTDYRVKLLLDVELSDVEDLKKYKEELSKFENALNGQTTLDEVESPQETEGSSEETPEEAPVALAEATEEPGEKEEPQVTKAQDKRERKKKAAKEQQKLKE